MGDARAVEPLFLCLDPKREPDPAIRGAAATALGALGDARAVEPLLLCLDPKQELGVNVRGSAATALGALGDARAVEPLLLCLDPKQELGVNVRGSAATALGALGDARAVAPLLLGLDPNRESNAIVRKSAAAALRKLDRKGNAGSLLPQTDVETKSQAKDAIVAKPPENAALKAFWEDLLEDFFLWTETPLESSFPRELERCLLSLERYLGGADSRGWSEKDYQRVLAALLAKDRGGVVTEAEPADRERTDILAQLNDGSQTVLELKFDDPKRLAEQLAQLRQYLASFKSDDRPTSGHLILLDRNPRPSWGEKQRRTEEDGISVWRVHVNRQPASKRTVSPDPAGRGSGAEGPVGK
jgi:hypothetical protein